MSQGGARSGKPPEDKEIERLINRRIRSLRLGSPSGWYKCPGRYKDPPEVPNTPPYFIKQRLLLKAPATGSVDLTPFKLNETYTTVFGLLSVSRWDVWGPCSDHTIRVIPYVIGRSNATGDVVSTEGNTYYGTGVSGAKRPYVSIMQSPRDTVPCSISVAQPILSVAVYDSSGAGVEANVIVDAHVTYFTSGAQIEGFTVI